MLWLPGAKPLNILLSPKATGSKNCIDIQNSQIKELREKKDRDFNELKEKEDRDFKVLRANQEKMQKNIERILNLLEKKQS